MGQIWLCKIKSSFRTPHECTTRTTHHTHTTHHTPSPTIHSPSSLSTLAFHKHVLGERVRAYERGPRGGIRRSDVFHWLFRAFLVLSLKLAAGSASMAGCPRLASGALYGVAVRRTGRAAERTADPDHRHPARGVRRLARAAPRRNSARWPSASGVVMESYHPRHS
jgi:hypothetical protein